MNILRRWEKVVGLRLVYKEYTGLVAIWERLKNTQWSSVYGSGCRY